jgi:hypothetical protein
VRGVGEGRGDLNFLATGEESSSRRGGEQKEKSMRKVFMSRDPQDGEIQGIG